VTPRWAVLSLLPLGLFLSGCPLTDHYQLQEDLGIESAAGLGGFGSAGESSAAGGKGVPGGCSVVCNTKRVCIDNACSGGWVPMAAPPALLVARSKAASVAMGKSVFIWGGVNAEGMALNNGAIYEPVSDSWTYLPPDPGSPSPRIMATAVWTGEASNKVIVFGGTDAAGGMIFKDGAVYDVRENSWSMLPSSPATGKRSAPFGYWDGTRAVFYGGQNAMLLTVPAADRFDLKTWSTSTNNGDPGQLGFPAIAFDGSVMYLQGGVIGSTRQDKVFAYTSSTDTWASLPKGPSTRTGAFGAWDGSHFVVWGGQSDEGLLADGKTLSGSEWSDMKAPSTLGARRIGFRRSGWAFQVKPGEVAIVGGQTSISGSSDTLATDGAIYAVQSGQWTAIASWPSGETHEHGVGVWTGEEFVVWGGRTQNVATLTGERWAP